MFTQKGTIMKPLTAAVTMALSGLVLTGSALAQEGSQLEEVLVTAKGDYFSILPDQPTDSAFGLDMSLVDTPTLGRAPVWTAVT